MENYILYFCAYFIEAIILWQYCNAIFQPKASTITRILSLSFLYGILSIVFTMNLISLNALLCFVANLIFIYFMFDSGLFSSLFHASLITTIMGLSEVAVMNFIPNMANNYYEETYHQQYFILLTLFSKLIYFFLLFIISHFFTKEKEEKFSNKKEILLILAIPLFSLFVTVTIFIVCMEAILSIVLRRMILISAFLLLIINLITWVIYSYTQRKNQEFTNMQLQLQKEQNTAEYHKMLLQQNESQQILIHDIKKHLHSISLLNEQGQAEKISAYIEQLVHSSDLQTTAKMCDHELLNAILGRFSCQCRELNIAFHTDVRSGTVNFMDENHLTALFCNLLENSVEAAENYPGGYIELAVSKHPHAAMTIITLINSCRVNPFDKYGRLLSKKPNKLQHGFGVKSIERITKCYGGEIKQYYKAEDYTFHTIILLRRPK